VVKTNFKKSIIVLLSILVISTSVFGSNSKNLNHVNEEKSFFSTERNKLVQKSYSEGLLSAIVGLPSVFFLGGIFAKKLGLFGTVEMSSPIDAPEDAPEETLVCENNLGIDKDNIELTVKYIDLKGERLNFVNVPGKFREVTTQEDPKGDSFYILKNYNGRKRNLLVRFLNKNCKDYNERREFYVKNFQSFSVLDFHGNKMYGICKNAVVMGICSMCLNPNRKCGLMENIPGEGQFLSNKLNETKNIYYFYDHHDYEQNYIKKQLPILTSTT